MFECSLSFILLRCEILPPYDACFFISYCVGGGGGGGGGGRIYLSKKKRRETLEFFFPVGKSRLYWELTLFRNESK